jgi:hypothetical protein
VYIRVAVIDSVISAGIRNIYVMVRREKASDHRLVAERNIHRQMQLV